MSADRVRIQAATYGEQDCAMSDLNSEANISFHTAKYEEVKSWYDGLPEDILAWLEENGRDPNYALRKIKAKQWLDSDGNPTAKICATLQYIAVAFHYCLHTKRPLLLGTSVKLPEDSGKRAAGVVAGTKGGSEEAHSPQHGSATENQDDVKEELTEYEDVIHLLAEITERIEDQIPRVSCGGKQPR